MPAPQRPTAMPDQRRTRLTTARAALVTIAVVIILVVAAIITFIVTRPAGPSAPDNGALPGTRDNTHVLDRVGPEVPTLVEFLDFECEACGAFYPVVEQLREDYDGKINYAFRYFPLQGHFNSLNAALAVEAAAQQGRVEDMYDQMFLTQSQWGEQQVSKADLFRSLAAELGLDMAAYDAAVADTATRERIREDFDKGVSLGVSGTPSFFLDGVKLELTKLSDLTDALDAAIGK